jgi:reductive dehalogenase
MFSRMRYEKGSERYEQYYDQHPELRIIDDQWREKPGLLKEGSAFYNPVLFSSADANFTAVECFHEIVDGKVCDKMTKTDPGMITGFIEAWAKKQGAKDVGFTLLRDYHKYTHVGRGEDFGKEVLLDHKHAIAVTVEMDKYMMDSAPLGPAVMESSEQYLKAGAIAVQVAQFIRNLGYPARAHIDGNYRVVCPLVARDAGIGEIGRMGLLMTPALGPRVRISVVTTDMPLIVNARIPDSSVIDFCRICKKCADICPSQAIPFDDRKEYNGSTRWQINSEKCFHYWCIAGTDCGRCVSVCPYSHPDNHLHQFIRMGVQRSPTFRKFALWMDDVFYGRKPKTKPLPKWMKSVQHNESNPPGGH